MCKFTKIIARKQIFYLAAESKVSNKKCNGILLTPPQGKAARPGG